MTDIYTPPNSNLTIPSRDEVRTRDILYATLIICVGLFLVSHSAPMINDLTIHFLFAKGSDEYHRARLISDLIQCTLFLFVLAYFIGKIFTKHWLAAGIIFSVIFIINGVRVFGFFHLLDGGCDRYWYDITSLTKSPLAAFFGTYIGRSAKLASTGSLDSNNRMK